jgi:ACR3 family arsenite efflux pump ArsB
MDGSNQDGLVMLVAAGVIVALVFGWNRLTKQSPKATFDQVERLLVFFVIAALALYALFLVLTD